MKIFFSPPQFFPSLKFFFKLVNSDVWFILDHLRFKARSTQCRCRIKTESGVQQLSIAVKRPCNKPFYQTIINNMVPWRCEFLKMIERSYSETKFFPRYFEDLKYYVESPNVLLETFNVSTIKWVAGLLNVYPELVFSHAYYKSYPRRKVEKAVLQKLNGEVFDEPFNHPRYNGLCGVFEENLSVLDALFCCGANEVRKMLTEDVDGKLY